MADDIKESFAAAVHEEGEEVGESGWFDFAEVRAMCERGEIGEGRTAAVLIEFIARGYPQLAG